MFRRLHIAVKAYRELLETLNAMDKSCDQQLKASAKVMKGQRTPVHSLCNTMRLVHSEERGPLSL